ncbi:MAG TPA: hypothetical protein VIV40_16745 [Kofleriaceae bacterium]
MARLGEHLVAARLLDQEQIDRALRAQVVWGGRLGTNLIELGMLDLDGISRALGRQHRVPAALARHFEKANRELQERLSAELAEQWSVVPLLHVGPQQKIAIAVIDRLPPHAIAELAEAFLCEPDGILVSIAAEMRVRYHLERVYGIARDTRFLRLRGASITPFPQFDNVPVPIDSDAEVAVPITVDDSAHPTGRASLEQIEPPFPTPPAPPPQPTDLAAPSTLVRAPALPENVDDLEKLIDDAIAQATADEPTEAVGRDRRSYVRTLADGPSLTPAPSSVVTGTSPNAASLGRIAIKRVPVPAQEARTANAPTFLEATRAIRRASHRDRVAELVIDTLHRFVPSCDAALLLVVRGGVATSWKQFSRSCQTSAGIAVPLDQPGLVPTVIERNAIARSSVAELTAIDELLMRSLGELRGDLVIVPIAIADKVMALIATATEPDAAVESIESIAYAAGVAFARLIRDAGR